MNKTENYRWKGWKRKGLINRIEELEKALEELEKALDNQRQEIYD